MSLDAIASAVPSVRQDAAEVARQTGADAQFIREKVGIAQRFILAPDETGVDLAEAACRRLFLQTGVEPETIDLLVFVTQNPDRKLPQNSAALSARLELPTTLASFDIALGCSGFVYGLAVVESLLAGMGARRAVLVTCDPYSRIMASEDKATNAVFGDAATAALVTHDGPGGRLGLTDFGTDGRGGDAIAVPAGGAARPLVALGLDEPSNYRRDELRLNMRGREVFNFVLDRVPASIDACLRKNGLSLDDIDQFALHQGSLHMLTVLARRAGIPAEKLLVNIDQYGNTVSSTIPLLLEPGLREGRLVGKTVLISGFGVGLSWATSVLRF